MAGRKAVQPAAAAERFAASIERLESTIVRSETLWLQRLRKSAWARHRALGLPGSRDEEWRQTSVSAIGAAELTRADDADPELVARFLESPRFASGGARLVIANGRVVSSLTSTAALAPGATLCGLAEALRSTPEAVQPHLAQLASWEDRSFTALNTAIFEDGAFLTIPAGVTIAAPCHLIHLVSSHGASAAVFPRNLLVVGEGAQVTVIESYFGLEDDVYFCAPVTEIVAADSARVKHWRVQRESRRAWHVAAVHSRQGRDSRIESLNVSLGAVLARNDIGAVLAGPGSECTLDGLYVADGAQHVDNHTVLDHAVPDSVSHEMYKGVLSGSARAVFNGRIIVRTDAQRTDAKQSNRNLLLSGDAVVHTRPQLEIYANDVKCTHGATIGRLDDDALFYLRSRGIGKSAARDILIHAFTGSLLGRISDAPLRDWIEEELAARLALAGEGAAA